MKSDAICKTPANLTSQYRAHCFSIILLTWFNIHLKLYNFYSDCSSMTRFYLLNYCHILYVMYTRLVSLMTIAYDLVVDTQPIGFCWEGGLYVACSEVGAWCYVCAGFLQASGQIFWCVFVQNSTIFLSFPTYSCKSINFLLIAVFSARSFTNYSLFPHVCALAFSLSILILEELLNGCVECSVSNKKGPWTLSPWKWWRALWKTNIWAQKALKNSGYTLMHCLSKIFKHWSYKLLDLGYFLWVRKHLWGHLKS